MEYSIVIENYLKAIFTLSKSDENGATTKSIGILLGTKPPTVSDMLKKLDAEKLINYSPYKSISLTEKGEKIAVKVIRKHRLWETFLVEKLDFTWDEVHDIAEQLEHIKSPKLVNSLDKFLGYPKFDPHGDPIPNEYGIFEKEYETTLDQIKVNSEVELMGVKDHSVKFLKYLDNVSMTPGVKIKVLDVNEYDKSVALIINGKQQTISNQVCKNLIVKRFSNKP
jgi:DtxR family transcriptional regulator, Mn-dependent transcriptional regulator